MYRKIAEWAEDNELQAFKPTYAYVTPTNGAILS